MCSKVLVSGRPSAQTAPTQTRVALDIQSYQRLRDLQQLPRGLRLHRSSGLPTETANTFFQLVSRRVEERGSGSAISKADAARSCRLATSLATRSRRHGTKASAPRRHRKPHPLPSPVARFADAICGGGGVGGARTWQWCGRTPHFATCEN